MEKDYSEELCIICLAIIAIAAMNILGNDSSNIISALAGGLIGYLKRNDKI